MKKLIIIILVLFSCQKTEKLLPIYNAQILGYEGSKVACKYGYMLKISNDTMLSNSVILRTMVGNNPVYPISVNIEYLITQKGCKYDYCEVVGVGKNGGGY